MVLNKSIVENGFTCLWSVLSNYKFEPYTIYNIDETGVTTVHAANKVIAKMRLKEVS